MKNLEFVLVSILLIFSFAIRLYKIDRPVADWHSWRQADTAAVSRNFIKEGFNPFIPKYDDMSSQANMLDNPNRYRFVEFPIYNIAVYGVWSITGVSDMWARMTTVAFSLLSTLLLYLIVRHYSGRTIAFLSAFFFAAIPYNVFYSSTILPGPAMVCFILALYYFFTKWLKKPNSLIWASLSVISANLAILTWPIAAFYFIPAAYLAFEKYGFSAFKKTNLWIFALLSIVPFLAWRAWEARFPEGIPNFTFLLNEGNIRFKGAFFRWIIIERLGKLIITIGGFILFVLGLIKKPGFERGFYYSWLVATALYLSVFASGNVRHDYYQVPIIPTLAIFMGIGTKTLFTLPKNSFNKFVGPVVAVLAIIFMIVFGYYEVQGYYWINKPQIVTAGKAVNRLLPKDATVIAPYGGDTSFLYQTNRHGYPVVDRPLEDLIDKGTKYLVSVDVGDAGIQNLARNCTVIAKTNDYVLVEMQKSCIGK